MEPSGAVVGGRDGRAAAGGDRDERAQVASRALQDALRTARRPGWPLYERGDVGGVGRTLHPGAHDQEQPADARVDWMRDEHGIDPTVTVRQAAVLGHGKELKVQLFPDQFPDWFGIKLAAGGRASTVLFPAIFPKTEPRLVDEERVLTEDDFMSGATEDRYPNIFRLARVDGGGLSDAREDAARRIAELPHHSLILGHDITAAADFLGKLLGLETA